MTPRSPRRPPQAPAKIADVARLAEVSVATVSRALANPEVVSEETRRRVLEAVRTTGYTPNIAARNLRARTSKMVLVVVPDIANSFFSEVLRGVEERLSAAGYGLIIANLGNSTEKEARYVDLAFARQVDGVLLLCGHVIGSQSRNLKHANLPLVSICERIPGESFPQVEIDNRAAARQAVEHLLARGHRRIAYLSGPRQNILDVERAAGYREALAGQALAPRADWLLEGDFSFSAGSRAAARVMAMPEGERPTALFAANDEMAIGFLKAVQEAGVRVPGDLAVVGFDGIAYADFCQPTLTTVVQPRREMGARAAEFLCAMMAGERDLPRLVQLEAHLALRASSASQGALMSGAGSGSSRPVRG